MKSIILKLIILAIFGSCALYVGCDCMANYGMPFPNRLFVAAATSWIVLCFIRDLADSIVYYLKKKKYDDRVNQ